MAFLIFGYQTQAMTRKSSIYIFIFSLSLIGLNCKVKKSDPEVNYANVTDESKFMSNEEIEKEKKKDEERTKQANTNEKLEKAYADDDYLRYKNHVYRPGIKSPQLYISGEPLSYPVLFLNDGKQLELHFDDLKKDFQTYSYDFVHCNANWQPSGLVNTEYIQGFFNAFIEEYEYSFNTLFPYIHYYLKFPNNDIRFTKSGNYLLKVYRNNDQDDLILTRRFYVVDQRIRIDASVKMATLARYRDSKQEVDFTLDHSGYPIQDPYNDLKVLISQNRRWDNAISGLKPLFIKTPELVYNYERENLFDGNNEFRFFDSKDLRYQSMNIDGIQIMDGQTHVYILPDEPRSYQRYTFWDDINGNRLIKRDDSQNANQAADYIKAHFTLKRETEEPGGDIYVFGAVTDWNFLPEFKMEYVAVSKEYRTTALIKQGYYNYAYVYLPDGKQIGDMSVIEGSHSETENDYFFLVYHRQQGEIYDRLVGFNEISARGEQ